MFYIRLIYEQLISWLVWFSFQTLIQPKPTSPLPLFDFYSCLSMMLYWIVRWEVFFFLILRNVKRIIWHSNDWTNFCFTNLVIRSWIILKIIVFFSQPFEVKLEPCETQEESREKGNYVLEKNAYTQNEVCAANEPEASSSPISEETRQRSTYGNNSASPSVGCQLISASEKRSVVVPRVEKQPASYQPEFPQDPSCNLLFIFRH